MPLCVLSSRACWLMHCSVYCCFVMFLSVWHLLRKRLHEVSCTPLDTQHKIYGFPDPSSGVKTQGGIVDYYRIRKNALTLVCNDLGDGRVFLNIRLVRSVWRPTSMRWLSNVIFNIGKLKFVIITPTCSVEKNGTRMKIQKKRPLEDAKITPKACRDFSAFKIVYCNYTDHYKSIQKTSVRIPFQGYSI